MTTTNDINTAEGTADDDDLGDLLQELRVLLPGTQTLTAFLVILPFNQGFAEIDQREQWVYLATFLCSLTSLAFFVAPAAWHRLERPLRDRARFKAAATRSIVIGLVPLSLALVLAGYLVVAQVVGGLLGLVVSVYVAALVGVAWWLLPLRRKARML